MIILITGDFGVGKDTFADILLDRFEENNISANKIRSFTTRKPRYEGEKTHEFIHKNCWEKIRETNPDLIAAESEIGGEYYGTLKNQFNHDFSLYVVDDIGVREITKKYDDVFIVTIFRSKSLLKNIDKERLNREKKEEYNFYPDYVLINDGDIVCLRKKVENFFFSFCFLNKPFN